MPNLGGLDQAGCLELHQQVGELDQEARLQSLLRGLPRDELGALQPALRRASFPGGSGRLRWEGPLRRTVNVPCVHRRLSPGPGFTELR